jgi:hypothetical protein
MDMCQNKLNINLKSTSYTKSSLHDVKVLYLVCPECKELYGLRALFRWIRSDIYCKETSNIHPTKLSPQFK